MDLREIEELIGVMEKHHLKKISLKKKDLELVLEKEDSGITMHPQPHAPVPPQIIEKSELHPSPRKEVAGSFITSPIVGTFYMTPSPNDPPYIKVGDKVEPETIVCIVEAMKVMNEVKASAQGVITEVLVKNGDPVEYGTKLFRLA